MRRASCVVRRASCVVRRASCVVRRASCVVRRASCVVRRASCVVCRVSCGVILLLLILFSADALNTDVLNTWTLLSKLIYAKFFIKLSKLLCVTVVAYKPIRVFFQGVALLPFVDEKRLLGALSRVYPDLTDAESKLDILLLYMYGSFLLQTFSCICQAHF